MDSGLATSQRSGMTALEVSVLLVASAVWGMSGQYIGMRVVLAVIALMLIAAPSRAQEQRVRIPDACRELANRAGLPLTLTPADAKRAVSYIRVMISEDPAVARCRVALRGY